MTESEIQKEIIDYCAVSGAIVFRMNSGSRNYNNKQAPKGTPDLFVVFKNKPVFIEVKTPTGKISEVQEKMHKRLRDLGQCVIVARCLYDVIGGIK